MRTTIVLPDGLYEQVKKRAQEKSITISSFLEHAIRNELIGVKREKQKVSLAEATGSGGTLPGVDIRDSKSLNEIIDFDLELEELR